MSTRTRCLALFVSAWPLCCVAVGAQDLDARGANRRAAGREPLDWELVRLCAGPNRDADAQRYLIVALPFRSARSGGSGVVLALDLPDGRLLWKLEAERDVGAFGYSLAVTPGVHHALQPDAPRVLIGAPGYSRCGEAQHQPGPRPGALFVVSTRAPHAPQRFDGTCDGDAFGHSIAVRPGTATDAITLAVGAPGGDRESTASPFVDLFTAAGQRSRRIFASKVLGDCHAGWQSEFGAARDWTSAGAELIVSAPGYEPARHPHADPADASIDQRGCVLGLDLHPERVRWRTIGDHAQGRLGHALAVTSADTVLVTALDKYAAMLSTTDGAWKQRWWSPTWTYKLVGFGYSAGMLGDVDGDGATEGFVGSFCPLHLGVPEAFGVVHVLREGTEKPLRSSTASLHGATACAIGDADGDRCDDYALVRMQRPISVELVSGRSGERLCVIDVELYLRR